MDIGIYNNSIPIKRVKFQVLTNKQVKRMSVVSKEINGINQTDMFTDGQATRGGLLDPRLGTTDFNTMCATCGLVPGECHGHNGHTDLAEPVFHFGYLETVKNVLGCICLRCAKLLIYKTEDEINTMLTTTKKGKYRFAEIKKLTSNITYCARADQNCGVPVPKIKKDVKKGSGVIQLIAVTNLQNIASSGEDGGQSSLDKKKQIREILTPRMVYDILKNVSDTDYRIMGFDPLICRPEDFIIKVFPIPPIAIRPSVKMSISSTTNYEDMLTGKLVDIIKANIRIRKQMDKESSFGEEPKYLNENVQLLQYHIATYFDNENMSLPKSEQKSGGRPTKSISDRIRGKTGRIRGNLMGKRTDFSARTVITSDPNLSLDELGVPIKIAMNITFPEVVTPYNIDEMTKLVKNGRYIYPGANFVIPSSSSDGKKYTIDLRYRKKGIKLRPGDVVERHIHDGDPVLFNRQPSLHKLSMMCHKVKVINDDRLATFRINVSVTTPYNADFDGDEMNMFVPQSIQTQLEIGHIADVSKQIITPRYSSPIIQLKQDTVLGTYQMTEKKVPVDWHDAMNILMNCTNIDLTKIIKENIDTHKLFSSIIPPLINVIDGEKLEIINGNLIKGVVSGSTLNNKIINYSWDRYGPKLTKDFIDNSQKLVINYLLQDGFTVGLGDAMIPEEDKLEVRQYVQEKVLEVQHLITEIENYPDLLDPDTFEKQIYSLLSTVKGDVPKKVMKKLSTDNHFYGMIESGAKGKSINLGQIVGALGQDILRFARIEKRVSNRTLVHFCQNDDTAESRGFITKSYFDGLDPHEFYFHHMAGREGLIDTAIKSVTGDTELIIMENGITRHIQIGEWIDKLLNRNSKNIEYDLSNNEFREELKLNQLIYIPTTDLDGNVSWGQITGITRHNPSEILYEIKTSSGRSVTVTDSHSLLVWNDSIKQFERIHPNKNLIGSFVPVTKQINLPKILDNSNMEIQNNLVNNELSKFINNNYQTNNIQELHTMNMFLNNNGLFGKINYQNGVYNLSIESNFTEHNDIVLDKIIEINKIKPIEGSKVYDLTVPSTLNFGLANGLHVVDTADTGYLQRKLIKGMEDVYIAYDGTVRSGNNVIIQMLFGDSHLDQTMQKLVKFNILSWGNKKIEEKCKFSESEIVDITKKLKYNSKQTKEFNEFNDEIVDIMRQFRDDFRILQEKAKLNNVTMKEMYYQPANYPRIIEDAKNSMTTENTPLDPLYVMAEIERLMDSRVCRLVCITQHDNDEDSPKIYNQKKSKYLFQIALYEYIGPRRCIYEYKFNKEKFDQVILEIIKSFNNSTVEPGEMVGVVASQSLGEPLTQMSLTKETKIRLKQIKKYKNIIIEENIRTVKIGEFVDNFMDTHKNRVNDIPNHLNSTETNLIGLNEEYFVCGVHQDDTVKWNKISHLSRHPTNGNLVKVTTTSGRTITTTKSHNFLIRTKDGIIPMVAKDLSVNTRIPVARYIEYQSNNIIYTHKNTDFVLNELFGWYCGIYLADGNINGNMIQITKDAEYVENKINMIAMMFNVKYLKRNYKGKYGECISYNIRCKELATMLKETFKTGSYNKVIPDWVHNANINFVRGLLRGYIDGEGNFSADRNLIRVGSRSQELIKDMSFLLAYFKIFSTNYTEGKSNTDKVLYCLGIAHKYAKTYKDQIGCEYPEKLENLNKIIKYSEKQHYYETDPIDAIPGISHIVAEISNTLEMPGNSRIYGRWERQQRAIGRKTLNKYIDEFTRFAKENNKYHLVQKNIDQLTMLYNGDVVWDKIKSIEEINDPKEYVYDFTVPGNETFMTADLICVHNTLNSVDWNDRILYQTSDSITNIKPIGEFIDNLMKENKNIQKIEDKPDVVSTDTEYLDISDMNITVPTVDENGKTSWKLIEAVTRHLPGHDGKLVKIKTKFGKEVSATKSKSFLTLVNGKLVDTNGSNITISDRLPVDMSFLENINLDNRYIFEDVYMDEIVEITEVYPSHEKVYDLTVAETRNFIMADGLCMRDTFHSTGSGVAGMQGVPRFRELLSYTKNPNTPYMVIYMNKDNMSNKEHAHRIGSTLKYTILNELAEQLDIIYDPDAKVSMTSYYNMDEVDRDSVFFLNNMSTTNIDNMPWLFRVTLLKENIVENEITMLDIKSKFIYFWNYYYSDFSNLKKPEKDVITKILHGCIMTSYDSSDNLIVHFRFELSTVDNQILSSIQDILLNKFNIKGNENIAKITKIDNQQFVSYNNPDQSVENSKEWVIYTEGIDMYSIRKIMGIDINRTYCNDIHIIYQAFGIEAARCALIKEFENVFDGNNVNYAHIALLGDVMTNNGGITSIDRHGINRLDTDPMGRASFEKTIEQLLSAAAFNETDYLRGVSSRIMVGRCIKGGTGLCDLVVDIDMVENSELDDTKEVKIFGSEFKTLKTSSLLDDLIKTSSTTATIYMPK